MQRNISPIQDLVALVAVYFVHKEKPQIVHSITPETGLIILCAAKLAGVPVRCTLYRNFRQQKGFYSSFNSNGSLPT
jgi:hypothetical protein